MKKVIIEWVDSAGLNGIWHIKEDVDSTSSVCNTIGFVIKEDKKEIVICQSYTKDCYGFVFTIPKCSITKIKRLK
jgi:hypothetical protein